MKTKSLGREQEVVHFVEVICANDIELAKEFLSTLEDETQFCITRILKRDFFIKRLHDLSGSCGLMGFLEWSRIFQRLESEVVDKTSWEQAKLELDSIVVEMQQLYKKLDQS